MMIMLMTAVKMKKKIMNTDMNMNTSQNRQKTLKKHQVKLIILSIANQKQRKRRKKISQLIITTTLIS